MEQSGLNWVFGIANLLLGAAFKWIYDSHRDLRKADEKLAEKVAEERLKMDQEMVNVFSESGVPMEVIMKHTNLMKEI